LEVDGEVVVDHAAKAGALHSFYSNLLGRARPTSWAFDLARLYRGAPAVRGLALAAPFDEKEVKAAIDGMDRASAPALMALAPVSIGRSGQR
jgi:hypothetical protein